MQGSPAAAMGRADGFNFLVQARVLAEMRRGGEKGRGEGGPAL